MPPPPFSAQLSGNVPLYEIYLGSGFSVFILLKRLRSRSK